MKSILTVVFAGLITLGLSGTALAHCGTCGTGAKSKLKPACKKKCAKAKDKKACVKKCKAAHKKNNHPKKKK